MLKNLRHLLEFLLILPLVLLSWLLPFRIALRLGKLLGTLVFFALPLRRQVVTANLTLAFPEWSPAQIKATTRACYEHFGISLAEFLKLPQRSFAQLNGQLLEIQGEEYLQQAIRGAGVVLSAHLGSWEFMGAFFSGRGLKLSVLVKPVHNPWVNAISNWIRRKMGCQIVNVTDDSREVISHLRRNRVVVFLADQRAGKGGVKLPFFGHYFKAFTGPALIMQRLKLPILPVFDQRVSLTQHRIIFHPPIYPNPAHDRETAIREVTEQYFRLVEAQIRKCPEQYFWFHRRWRKPQNP